MHPNQTTDIPQVTRGRLLSEAEFDELSSRPYDPSWFDALRLGPQDHMTLLNGFTSKIKIDELIRGGALAAGDIFRADVEVKIAADSDETKYMTMEAEFFGPSPQGQLNIRIRAPRDPSGHRIVKCTGLGKIVEAWMQEDPLIVEGSSNYSGWYVSRNGTDLGSLWTVRQKWHLWREEKEAWAAYRGQTGRHKRVSRAEKKDGYSYVKGRLTRTNTRTRTNKVGDDAVQSPPAAGAGVGAGAEAYDAVGESSTPYFSDNNNQFQY